MSSNDVFPIASTLAFVILSTAKDLKARLTTALMGSSIIPNWNTPRR